MGLLDRVIDWLLSSLGVGGAFIFLTGIAVLVGWYGGWYGWDLIHYLSN